MNKVFNKTLVLGLDGATFHLVKKWADEGYLPNLKRLIEGGCFGILRSVPNLNSAAAWSSLATGLNPGRHGIFFFHEHIKGSFQLRFLNATHRQGSEAWDVLSSRGRRVIVLNVPMTFPAREVNGLMIAGLDSPSSHSAGFCFPQGLYEELIKHTGAYTIECDMGRRIKRGQLREAIDAGIKTIRQRKMATEYLMTHYPWDFFMVVFRVIDNVQHHFWRYMNPDYPLFHERLAKRFGNAIQQTYEEIDRSIGEILSKCPDGSNIIIVSDHGSALVEFGIPYLNQFLEQTGYLSSLPNKRGFMPSLGHHTKRFLNRAIEIADIYIGSSMRHFIKKTFFRTLTGLASERYYPNIDWTRSKAYSPHARPEIWINLRDREPFGIVESTEYDSICDEIIERLYEWHDPATNQRVIKSAKKRNEIYNGPYVEKAPDITVQFNDIFVTGIRLPEKYLLKEIGRGFDPLSTYKGFIFGKHADNGIIIANGPDFKKGQCVEEANISDLMPTILYLMGENVPFGLDGRVLSEIIKKEFLHQHKIRISSEKGRGEGEANDFTKSDSELIRDRLKNLGYVE